MSGLPLSNYSYECRTCQWLIKRLSCLDPCKNGTQILVPWFKVKKVLLSPNRALSQKSTGDHGDDDVARVENDHIREEREDETDDGVQRNLLGVLEPRGFPRRGRQLDAGVDQYGDGRPADEVEDERRNLREEIEHALETATALRNRGERAAEDLPHPADRGIAAAGSAPELIERGCVRRGGDEPEDGGEKSGHIKNRRG